ncbi:MAG: L,D-transpeptidase [Lactobacillaceae bacterium]|jgi:murein L,D-transpeptidase YafK|nr:L,D-transpeptidase [Lactobacillaceae bacterium]
MKTIKLLSVIAIIVAAFISHSFYGLEKSSAAVIKLTDTTRRVNIDTIPEKTNIDPGPLIVLVSKSDKTLTVCHEFSRDTVVCFTVRTGLNAGPKMVQGDKRTPVGEYKIIAKYSSKLVRFLALNYPNEEDIAAGRTGGSIGIHYLGQEMVRGSVRAEGSSGCISVWDKQEIFKLDSLLPVGTRVFIRE